MVFLYIFLRTYEVVKYSMIKLYLDVEDVILTKEHTKYGNSGLHVNCCIVLLMQFCFMMKNDHFK